MVSPSPADNIARITEIVMTMTGSAMLSF
jgi:hypothetical protein